MNRRVTARRPGVRRGGTGVLAALVATTLCGGCAVYRIDVTEDYEALARTAVTVGSGEARDVQVDLLNEFPEGAHCFEPLAHVLSLGIIPTHCVDRFHVSRAAAGAEADRDTHFRVSYMQGWVALGLALSPQWKLGYGEDIDSQLLRIVTADTAQAPE